MIIASISDVHCPFHDVSALSACMKLLKEVQPSRLYINGDFIDFYALSRFSKDPARALELQSELNAAHRVLAALRNTLPKTRFVYLQGNHEERFYKYLNSNAPALRYLDALDLRQLMGLGELGVEWEPEMRVIQGRVGITHGCLLSSISGQTVRKHIDKWGLPHMIVGHCHSLGVYHQRRMIQHVGYEQGCLCRMDPEYDPYPNWQQGFAIGEVLKNSVNIELVQIHDGVCRYSGKTYRGKTKT